MIHTITLQKPLTALALLASLLATPALYASHLDAAIQHADEASTAKDSADRPGCKARKPSSTISPTTMRGFIEEYGSWNTICISAQRRRRASP